MRRLSALELYTSIDACLDFGRSLTAAPARSSTPIPVHFFWQSGPFGAKPALCLKSFLATQDPQRFRAWLWLEDAATFERAPQNPRLAPLLPHVELRRYDTFELARGTVLEGSAWIRELSAPARSDLARLFCTFHHGGCYSDLDALFLRDLAPLFKAAGDAEFCFQWSAEPAGTNAFCRHHSGSPIVDRMLQRAALLRSAHPRALLSFPAAPAELLLLPVSLFSPLWLLRDGHASTLHAPFRRFADFFRRFSWFFAAPRAPLTLNSFFPGAFTYHWHGRWSDGEHRASFAGLLDDDCRARLVQRGVTSVPEFGR